MASSHIQNKKDTLIYQILNEEKNTSTTQKGFCQIRTSKWKELMVFLIKTTCSPQCFRLLDNILNFDHHQKRHLVCLLSRLTNPTDLGNEITIFIRVICTYSELICTLRSLKLKPSLHSYFVVQ